uniref:Uncharacterized protein n=1 Tax=Clastoptera arizonana TaxID=38151 RepID=A0A1B6DXL0_9HEMI
MSAPIERTIYDKEGLWVNPCGGTRNPDYDSTEQSYHDYNDPKILDPFNPIVVLCNNSLTHAKLFRDQYVKKTFEQDFAKQLEMWSFQSVHYDWLPSEEQLPKSLGQPTSPEHLDSLKINDVLLDTYEYLQKIAVGLEQVVWDLNKNGGEFIQNFQDAESFLRGVLCEIHMAIFDRRITQRPDVTRDIMSLDMRELSTTHRKLRDWVIFRDYMNCLEYVREVFEYFNKNPSKLGSS